MTSGTRSREWVLRFERRRPFFVEPLMGWTGDDDPIGQVELRFPDLQSAAAYADREGISYRIADAEHVRSMASAAQDERASYVDAVEETLRSWLAMAWLQAQHGQAEMPWLPDLDRALINPAAVFRSPEDVLSHPLLATNIKRRILQQWAWDEYLIEVAADEAMVDSAPSRLAEVKSALAKLESWPAETIVTFRDRPLPAHEERV